MAELKLAMAIHLLLLVSNLACISIINFLMSARDNRLWEDVIIPVMFVNGNILASSCIDLVYRMSLGKNC